MPRTTRKATTAIACAAVTLLAGGASLATTPANAATPSLHGCPYGAVCVYPQNKGYNGDRPEAGGVYFAYKAYNLHNQFGTHVIVNNQYGGAGYKLCTGYSGRGCPRNALTRVGAASFNLTPINSIVLTRPSSPPTLTPEPVGGIGAAGEADHEGVANPRP